MPFAVISAHDIWRAVMWLGELQLWGSPAGAAMLAEFAVIMEAVLEGLQRPPAQSPDTLRIEGVLCQAAHSGTAVCNESGCML